MSPEGTAFALRDRGLPIATIAREIGISRSTVGEWLKGYGETFYDLRCEAEGCGRPFVAFRSNQRYCSPCQAIAWKGPKPVRIGECEYCRGEFRTKRDDRRFCSETCGRLARQKFARMIDVAPFRDAFLRSDMTAAELARRLGITRTHWNVKGRFPDHTRALRCIGLVHDTSGHGSPRRIRKHVRRSTALKLCEALHLDPVEVGL